MTIHLLSGEQSGDKSLNEQGAGERGRNNLTLAYEEHQRRRGGDKAPVVRSMRLAWLAPSSAVNCAV